METRRFRLTVAYDGTAYCGWQVQPQVRTIEGELNRCLSELTGEKIQVIGASRTDTGVHALGNIAVFDSATRIPAEKLPYAINQRLPEDIRVQKGEWVPDTFHPRRCASRKTYEYRIYSAPFPLPTVRLYSYFTYHRLELAPMQKAAALLLGEHDFTSFCSAKTEKENKVRTLYEGTVQQEGDFFLFRVTGNGFLYNMVRILAGTLLQMGQGSLQPEQIPAILAAKDRRKAGPTLPPEGLTLRKIQYESEEDCLLER